MHSRLVSVLSPIPEAQEATESSGSGLDETFRTLLATKFNPLVARDGTPIEGELNFKTKVLCEVLELDEDAMSALELHERNKVLNEAKRNTKEFPNLTNVERVDVNRALVKLKEDDREKDLNEEDDNPGLAAAGGRYLPVFWEPNTDGDLRVHWMWDPLHPVVPAEGQGLGAYQTSINEMARRHLDQNSEESLENLEEGENADWKMSSEDSSEDSEEEGKCRWEDSDEGSEEKLEESSEVIREEALEEILEEGAAEMSEESPEEAHDELRSDDE